MSLPTSKSWSAFAMALALFGALALAIPSRAQDEISRKIKSRVAPIYPALARQMNISGIVKIQVTVATNGTVKTTKVIGGHPLLANAALDAVKKWRFDAGPEETTGIVEFKFDPSGGAQ